MKSDTIKQLYNKFKQSDSVYLTIFINTRKEYIINKLDDIIITKSEIIINEKTAISNDIIKILDYGD